RKSRKRVRAESADKELERLNSLPWSSAIAETDVADDDFSVFMGSNNLEGGFLSLEEIDEVNCGLEIQRFIAASTDGHFDEKLSSKISSNKNGAADEPYGEDDQDRRDYKCDKVKRETTKKKNKKHKKKKSQKNDAANEQAQAAPV
ncbi:hypothetical protein M569_13425, partial [Genlisea aurea]